MGLDGCARPAAHGDTQDGEWAASALSPGSAAPVSSWKWGLGRAPTTSCLPGAGPAQQHPGILLPGQTQQAAGLG